MTHHEFSKNATQQSETAVQTILNYLEEKNINPFMPGPQRLRNIMTEELVHPEIAKQLLSIFEKGIDLYNTFRKKRLVERTKLFSAVMSRNNLPNFKSIPKSELPKTVKTTKFIASDTPRIVALAKERNYPTEKLLKYELTNQNMLFYQDGLFKKYDDKSSLIRELENFLTKADKKFSTTINSCLVVDVMLVMHTISWKGLKTFKNLAEKFCEIVKDKT